MNQDKGEYPDTSENPWNRLSERVNRALWEAGLTKPEEIARLSNHAFLKQVPGIGRAALEEIRQVFPNPRSGGPKLVPRPDGRGALLTGGVPGNRGGCGAVPSKVRAASRAAYDELVPRLLKMGLGDGTIRLVGECENCGHTGEPITMDDVEAAIVAPKEQIRAADVLGKYGLGQAKGVDHEDLVEYVKTLGEQVQDVLESRLGTEHAEELCQAIFTQWRKESRDVLG